MKPFVRAEASGDVAEIRRVTEIAFLNAKHTNHAEHLVIEALRSSGALTFSLVADHGGMIVGHIAVSPVTITGDIPNWFGLGPVAVRPDMQRRGIGSALVLEVLRRLRDSGAAGCVVLGEPSFYSRFGFSPEPGLVLHGIEPEAFQAISFNGRAPYGVVSYHKAFNS